MSGKREARQALAEDLSGEEPMDGFYRELHVYEGERCVHCNTNVYDNDIYGPFACTRSFDDTMSYTTETGKPAALLDRPMITVWGLRTHDGRPWRRHATDADLENRGLELERYAPRDPSRDGWSW